MFAPLDTTSQELRNELLLQNNWETIDSWFKELPKIVHASTVLLTASPSDLPTEIQGLVEVILEVKEVRTILSHKADQLQGAGNQWAGELETNQVEEDYLAICHERLEQLNESEQRISENVARLAERSEINEGQERERVAHSIKKI